MTPVAASLIPLLQPLEAAYRAELASWLIDSIDGGEDVNHDQAWDEEISRRSAQIHAGTVSGIPAAQVFAEIRRRHL